MKDLEEQFERIVNEIGQGNLSDERLRDITKTLEDMAENGFGEACEVLAELFAFQPSIADPEAAYQWYFVAKSLEGFSVEFNNQSEDKTIYYGADGDFRNEAEVSAIVDELGLERIQELDAQADLWKRNHLQG